MELSAYRPDDADEIERLFLRTFSDSEGLSEGALVGGLARALMLGTAESDLYGFVASDKGQIVGCILLSRMRFERPVNAFILAPVAIRVDHQRHGLGQKLITFGLNVLKRDRVELVLTYGDPRFYSKVGFRAVTEALVPAPFRLSQPEGWMAQSLVGDEIEPIVGQSYCVDALNRAEYW
jgi:predicted N-acetyltransferase YhbS